MTVDLERRRAICSAHGLSESTWADRLVGETEDDLRSDAVKVAAALKEWRDSQPLAIDAIRSWTEAQIIERWDDVEKVLAERPTRGPLPEVLTPADIPTMTRDEVLARWSEVEALLPKVSASGG